MPMPRIADARPSQVVYSVYDQPPPITTYASGVQNNSLLSQNHVPATSNRTNSAVVNRRPRRNGLRYFYGHGGLVMPFRAIPSVGTGGVQNSFYQTILVQLHDWSQNLSWFAAGYPRNLGYSTRVSQLNTNVTGGSTNAAMNQRPLFPKVQRVPRYSVRPNVYQTKSSKG
jgi:hypothetical protein